MSAKRKQSAVLRLLRGEDLELVSRELGVPAAEVSGWRDAFLAAGEASLKTRPADGRDAEIGRLKAKLGDLTMANELLEVKIEHLEAGRPLPRLRSSGRPGRTGRGCDRTRRGRGFWGRLGKGSAGSAGAAQWRFMSARA
jgi:hypothetical protein